MKTIAFIIARGGVGKTTTTRAFAEILAERGKKVLVVDLDPQLNTSMQFDTYEKGGLCVAHLLVDKTLDIKQVIRHTNIPNIDVIPCDKGLEQANQQALTDTANVQQMRLKRHFRAIKDDYDFCLLDCPTAIKNVSTINGLAFTDDVIVPMTIDGYSLEGINDVAAVVNDVKEYNEDIEIKGVVITKWERSKMYSTTESQLKQDLGGLLFDTHIRKTVKISESTFNYGKGLLECAKGCTAVEDYYSLVDEYLKR